MINFNLLIVILSISIPNCSSHLFLWNNFYSNNFGSKTEISSSLNDLFKNSFIQWMKQLEFSFIETPKHIIDQNFVEASSQENATKQQTSSFSLITSPKSTPSKSSFNLLKIQKDFNLQTTKSPISSVKMSYEFYDESNELKHSSCVNGEFKKDLNDEKFYFRCLNGELKKFECEGKSFWFHDVLSCVIKEQETVFRCDQQHVYPDLTNCKNYYRCGNSRFIKFQCPDDLVWNQKLLTCDSPKNVFWCRAKPQIIYDFKMAYGSCNRYNAYKNDIKFCDRFYFCEYNGRWTQGQCPPSSIWIKHLNRCDLIFNGHCDDKYSVSDPMKNAFDMLSVVINKNQTDQTIVRVKNVCKNFFVKLQEKREKKNIDEDSQY